MGWLAIVLATLGSLPQPSSFTLQEGDRIVFLGDAVAEAMQDRGDLELRLTARFPNAQLRFRNLAFAGDTVWGDALAGFDSAEQGYTRRLDLIRQASPTVLLIAFGSNESWAGPDGLDPFLQAYKRLLDDLNALGPREIVLLGPLRQENLGPPYPDPSSHNADLDRYRQAIRSLAASRKLRFVDLALPSTASGATDPPGSIPPYPLTDDGLHPTDSGHARLAQSIEQALGISPNPQPAIQLEPLPTPEGQRVARLVVEPESLVVPTLSPTGPIPSGPPIIVQNLPPGRYTLRIDGHAVATADSSSWANGFLLPTSPDLDQLEQLRQAIHRKNRLYFDQVRPQNNVYLFGFRKHEQGNNAAEIPRFDPLIAAQEAEIARLRRPRPRTFELLREMDEVKP